MLIKKILILLVIISMIPLSAEASYINASSITPQSPPLLIFDSRHDVTIEVNPFGVAYGQELLWTANTTGTNYEESAVTYTNGIAYIGSCATHGAGHNKLFAVDTTTGDILWSNDTGPTVCRTCD